MAQALVLLVGEGRVSANANTLEDTETPRRWRFQQLDTNAALEMVKRHDPALQVAVVAAGNEPPVSLAERLHAADEDLEILIVEAGDRGIRESVAFSPRLGRHVRLITTTEPQELRRQVSAAIERRQTRRRHQAQLARAQRSLETTNVRPRSGDFLGRFLRRAPIGVALLHVDGSVVSWNPWLERVLGRSERQAQTSSIDAVLPGLVAEQVRELAHQGNTIELEVTTPSGRYSVLEVSAVDVGILSGSAINMLLVVDITERLRREQLARRRLQLDLQEEKAESLVALAGGVAHDFNNLLTSVLGNADLLRAQLETDEVALPLVEAIRQAAYRAAGLSRMMLTFTGHGFIQSSNVDLGQLVDELRPILEEQRPRDVILRFDGRRELPPMHGDPEQLRQMVINIVANAFEACVGDEGMVQLDISFGERAASELSGGAVLPHPPAGQYLELVVSDTGSGMADRVKQRLFEPFFTTKGLGRGLGLAAVLGVVRAHRGSVFVESAIGVGTRVRVLLPTAGVRWRA